MVKGQARAHIASRLGTVIGKLVDLLENNLSAKCLGYHFFTGHIQATKTHTEEHSFTSKSQVYPIHGGRVFAGIKYDIYHMK